MALLFMWIMPRHEETILKWLPVLAVGLVLLGCSSRSPVASGPVLPPPKAELAVVDPADRHPESESELEPEPEPEPEPENGQRGPLRLDGAIDEALRASPELRQIHERVEAAGEQVRQAEAAFYPKLTLAEDFNVTNNPVFALMNIINQRRLQPTVNFNDPGTHRNFSSQARGEWLLFQGGSRWFDRKAAQGVRYSVEAELEAARNQLTAKVTETYYRWLQSLGFIRVAEKSLEAARTDQLLGEARYRVEMALPGEVARLKARTAETHGNLVSARTSARRLQAAMERLLARPITGREVPDPALAIPVAMEEKVEAEAGGGAGGGTGGGAGGGTGGEGGGGTGGGTGGEGGGDALGASPGVEVSLRFEGDRSPPSPRPSPSRERGPSDGELVERALDHRPEMAAMRALIESARDRVRAAQGGLLPTFGTSANYQWDSESFGESAESWMVGFQATWPLFEGGVTASRIREARARLREMEARGEQIALDIALEVHHASLAVGEAAEKIQVARERKAWAEQALEEVRHLYRNEMVTVDTLLQAEISWSQAELSWAEALFEGEIARALLQRSLGDFAACAVGFQR